MEYSDGLECVDGLERVEGRRTQHMDAAELAQRTAGYDELELDLGTGDGRYVQTIARKHPERFVIGVDACRENLRDASRRAPSNALYLVANALALPTPLDGLATRLTINFPWGSLLRGLLDEESGLPLRLTRLVRSRGLVQVRLNAGALGEAGYALGDGMRQVRRLLRAAGFTVAAAETLGPRELRAVPTSWAQRLAFGRDPRALALRARVANGSGEMQQRR